MFGRPRASSVIHSLNQDLFAIHDVDAFLQFLETLASEVVDACLYSHCLCSLDVADAIGISIGIFTIAEPYPLMVGIEHGISIGGDCLMPYDCALVAIELVANLAALQLCVGDLDGFLRMSLLTAGRAIDVVPLVVGVDNLGVRAVQCAEELRIACRLYVPMERQFLMVTMDELV